MAETEELVPFREGINVDLLMRVIEQIEEEPRRLYMHGWGSRVDANEEGNPPCGTVGCIAGWASLLNGAHIKEDKHGFYNEHGEAIPVGQHAADILNITDYEANRLFYVEDWPLEFLNDYDRIGDDNFEGRAAVTTARIRHFIETGR